MMNDASNHDTEPETDYSVWGFEGNPPILEGGSLNDDSHNSDAHAVAEADGWTGPAASYLVNDAALFEQAAKRLRLRYTNMNDIDIEPDALHEPESNDPTA